MKKPENPYQQDAFSYREQVRHETWEKADKAIWQYVQQHMVEKAEIINKLNIILFDFDWGEDPETTRVELKQLIKRLK